MYEVFVQIEGEVKYNEHTLNEFVPERISEYISQHDIHMGETIATETLNENFSSRCQDVGSPKARIQQGREILRIAPPVWAGLGAP